MASVAYGYAVSDHADMRALLEHLGVQSRILARRQGLREPGVAVAPRDRRPVLRRPADRISHVAQRREAVQRGLYARLMQKVISRTPLGDIIDLPLPRAARCRDGCWNRRSAGCSGVNASQSPQLMARDSTRSWSTTTAGSAAQGGTVKSATATCTATAGSVPYARLRCPYD